MTGMIVCLSAAVAGVDYGWQPVAGGGIEYIIQIEPQMLERLKAGQDVFSDLPPQTGNVRGYRITVGTAILPHQGQPPPRDAGQNGKTPPARGPVSAKPRTNNASTLEAAALAGPLPGPVLAPVLPLYPIAPPSGRLAAEPPPLQHLERVKPLETQPTGFEKQEPIQAEAPNKRQRRDHGEQAKSDDVQAVHEARRPALTAKRTAAREGAKAPATGKTRPEANTSGLKPAESTSEKTTVSTRPSLALFGFFASLGGNAFLLWVAASQRSRYRALAKLASARSCKVI